MAEAASAKGEALLLEWGVTETAGPLELEGFLGRDVEADLAIVLRLGGLADPESARILQECAASPGQRERAKAAKRALYRLTQRGVAVPPPVVKPVPKVTVEAPGWEGFLSHPDGNGDQLVWILRPRAQGVDHLFAIVNDRIGLREVGLAETSRKDIRRAREEMKLRHDITMVPVDWRWCDFRIAEGHRRAREAGTTVEGDYPRLRGRLGSQPVTTAITSPLHDRWSREEILADPVALAESPSLLDEPEFRTWIPAPETMLPYLKEIAAVSNSPIVLTDEQQRERFGEILDRAVASHFGGEVQSVWADRFEAMALHLLLSRREAAARRAFACSLALRDGREGGRGIPFCEVLVRSVIANFVRMASESKGGTPPPETSEGAPAAEASPLVTIPGGEG